MLWFSNLPIKQRRRLFPSALPQGMLSVHSLLAVQKKVNKRFFFLIAKKESKMGFPCFFLQKAVNCFLLPGQKKGNNGFPSSLLVAGFFGYFFFVAGDKEKVTI